MKRNRSRLILLLALLPFNSLIAQERLSLQDAIVNALEYNHDIQIVRVQADQAKINNTAGNAGMLPNINASGSYGGGSANTHIEFADGRLQKVDNALSETINGAVLLQWTLFDGGSMFYRKRQLNELEEYGEAQLKAQIQTTVSQVIQAYAQVVWQQQQMIAIDTGLLLARVRMQLSQANFETGASAKVDYLQARVDYNARQSDSLYQKAALISSFAQLNALMGKEADHIYIVDDSLTVQTNLEPKDKELLQQLNPGLDLARRNVAISKLDEKIVRAAHLPTVALNGGYNYTQTSSQAGFALFNRSNGPSGSVSINLPIYQGGNIRRNSRIASLQTLREELLYDRQRTDLSRRYRSAWANYRMSVEAFILEKENIAYAKENLDIQQERFKVGISTTLETREAENGYVQALVRLYTAIYNLKVNETLVKELEGELVR